jgi:alkanesulfonate monooxygenase
MRFPESVEIYTTCPGVGGLSGPEYLDRAIEVGRWSDELGCAGTLIFTDNSAVDPWAVAQALLTSTAHLRPLVAVQPVYMHPYAVAKKVATLGFLFGRAVALNAVAGGFKNDLEQLGDPTPHDQRYERLVEYTQVILALLGGESVRVAGRHYQVNQLRLTPPLPAELLPRVMCSGSSAAGLAAARAMGALAVCYPKPAGEYEGRVDADGLACGARVGVVAREQSERAWQAARTRFPEDRRGQIAHALAMKTSDSAWHRQLSELAGAPGDAPDHPYWLHPFQNYQGFCPYLVGSYERVAREVRRYMGAGFRTFILDIPPSAEELRHTARVFERAVELAIA